MCIIYIIGIVNAKEAESLNPNHDVNVPTEEFGIHQIQDSFLVYTEVVLIRIHISNWKLKTTDG